MDLSTGHSFFFFLLPILRTSPDFFYHLPPIDCVASGFSIQTEPVHSFEHIYRATTIITGGSFDLLADRLCLLF